MCVCAWALMRVFVCVCVGGHVVFLWVCIIEERVRERERECVNV